MTMASIVERITGGQPPPAEDIATYLDWPSDGRSRRALFDGCLLLKLGEEPALAIADRGADPLAFAYHSGYEWVLDVRLGEAPRFANTRWRAAGKVYELRLDNSIAPQMVGSLTPTGFEEDRPSLTARRYQPFETQVATIESSLIKKLGDFRRMAFRLSSAEPLELDQAVHLFVTQLFILRALEDLNLAHSINLPPLSSAIQREGLDINVLQSIFEIAREKVQPTLFDPTLPALIAPAAVFEGIKALYVQHEIPNSSRLNFGWIDPDVFGRVYERYLSTVLAEGPAPVQPSLFEGPSREVEELSRRKQGGVYYTPQPLVRILVQKAIDIARPDGLKADDLPRIADFSCGSGAFLAAVLDKIVSGLPQGQRTDAARMMIQERRIVGVDIDSRAVALARLNLYLRLAQENEMLPLPDVNDCVYQSDSLAQELPADLDSLTYDAVVGNPPFLPIGQVQNREAIEAHFETAVGRYDFSSLFLELAVRRVREGGAIALVVPNRLFGNTSADAARRFILQSCEIDTIVDFGSAQVFEKVSAYVGLLICRRRAGAQSQSSNVRYVRARKMPNSFSLEPVSRAIFSREAIESYEIEAFNDTPPKIGEAWTLTAPFVRTLLNKVEDQGVPLSELAEVKQGIKTGANYIYILKLMGDFDGELVLVADGTGRHHYLETALLRPVAMGAEVIRYKVFGYPTKDDSVLLYPYANGLPIPETVLEARYPNVYKYLSNYRPELEGRASVAKARQPWYGLIWPREDDWLSRGKILSRDLISKPSFAVDLDFGVALVGGTAIIPAAQDQLFSLLGIMNCSWFDLLLRQGASEFRGNYIKAEPGRLLALSIPNALLEDDEISRLVGLRLDSEGDLANKIEGEIDSIVRSHLRSIIS